MWKYNFFIIVLSILISIAMSNMDLFIPEDEVYKLFGVQNAQLYYMHDGKLNGNALEFTARVQSDHNLLKYQWQKRALDMQIAYNIDFKIMSRPGMKQFDKNLIKISLADNKDNGVIQELQGSFDIIMNCSGTEAGNITFHTNIVFHWYIGDNSVQQNIVIKRLKLCKKYNNSSKKDSSTPNSSNEELLIDTTNMPPAVGSQQSTSAFFISIGTVVLFIAVIFIVCCWWHVRMNRKHGSSKREALHRMHIGPHSGNQFLRLDLPNNAQHPQSHSNLVQVTPFINDLGADISEIRAKLSDMSLPRDKVNIGDLMLKGTFARTYKGTTGDGTGVLIKTVTDEATEEQQRLLLFESSLLRGMHHRNLLTMKYVVLDTHPDVVPMVLFPFREGGNLKHFLQSLKMNESPNAVPGLFSSTLIKFDQVSTQELVEVAIQIACGMTYLSKRGLVHKDLAARNCLIDNDLKVKITDYALSRDTFPADYCCLGDYENRPVRWLALESLVHKLYSSSSDVWSFGVLLWELQSLAATPYSDIDDFEMADYLSDGFRLSQPINCPDPLYNIMAGCWHYSPDQRPVFTQLLQLLTEFNAELVDYV